MTGRSKTRRGPLDRLAAALVDDILNASDEDILAEFQETDGDPERHAADMRARFEKALIAANKQRLTAARAGVAAGQLPVRPPVVDIAKARAQLRAVLNAPGAGRKLTLAARKESEMSDADIITLLDDLRELGALPPGDDESGSA